MANMGWNSIFQIRVYNEIKLKIKLIIKNPDEKVVSIMGVHLNAIDLYSIWVQRLPFDNTRPQIPSVFKEKDESE